VTRAERVNQPEPSVPPASSSSIAVVWVVGALVLVAYVVLFSIGRTTHGFIAYYSAARLLAAGQLGPLVYDDAWFGRYVQEISGTPVLEIFGPNTPAMALLALPVAFLDPATARTAWLIASQAKRRRQLGFWCFLVSNVLWIAWGWHDGAYALIVLQLALAALNVRGARKNEPAS